MSKQPTAVTVDALLAHQDWLRRLAGALVRDAHAADDLVQETMLTALRSPPKTDVEPRHWLAVVLRNAFKNMRRSSKRRDARERAAARNEALPATLEALALASMQRDLVEHVLQLDEPLREVVLLRYFADMPPREIAEQLDRPLNSVKSSLQRGLAQLRVELDVKQGGREKWLAVLAPFAPSTPLALATKVWMGAALLLLLGGVAWLSLRGAPLSLGIQVTSLPDSTAVSAGVSVAGANAASPGESAQPNVASGRSPVGIEMTTKATAPSSTPDASGMRARFVAPDGSPLVGFRVRIVDREQPRWSDRTETVIIAPSLWLEVSAEERSRLRASEAELEKFTTRYFGDPAAGRSLILGTPIPDRILVTNAEGELESRFEHGRESFAAANLNKHTLLATGRTRHDLSRSQVTCVFVPSRALHGRVLGRDGLGLARAEVGIRFDDAFRSDLPVGSFECSALDALRATTDDDGRFALASIPRVAVAGFTVTVDGRKLFLPHACTVEELDRGTEIVVSLPLPAASKPAPAKPLLGVVVRADGSPARHARIVHENQVVEADSDGRFELRYSSRGRLWALERGFGYGVLEPGWEPVPAGDDARVRLVITNPPGSINGVVLDERRLPVAGVEVSIAETTQYVGMRESIEAFLAGSRSLRVETDANGRFRLEGLLSREYTLRARRAGQASAPIRALPSSAAVTLELPPLQRYERIHGRATTLDGRPLTLRSVSVVSASDAVNAHDDTPSPAHGTGQSDGTFEVRNVACSDPVLVVTADGYMPERRALDENAAASECLFRLAPACRVLVAPPATSEGGQLCVRGASNEELVILGESDAEVAAPTRLSVKSGAIPAFLVSELATEVLLMRGAEIVARRSVRLDPDKVTRVDF